MKQHWWRGEGRDLIAKETRRYCVVCFVEGHETLHLHCCPNHLYGQFAFERSHSDRFCFRSISNSFRSFTCSLQFAFQRSHSRLDRSQFAFQRSHSDRFGLRSISDSFRSISVSFQRSHSDRFGLRSISDSFRSISVSFQRSHSCYDVS